jgi:hypothetical protein
VPILVAIHARTSRRVEVTASILAGAAAVLIVQFTLGNAPGSVWTPATIGLLSASAAYVASGLLRRRRA